MRSPIARLGRIAPLARRLAIFIAVAASAAQAQRTIHVPADEPTIQAGINAANPGDTVLVAPGTYYENVRMDGKAITLQSSDGPTNTIIDGGAKNPVLYIGMPSTTAAPTTAYGSLIGFTIQNGFSPAAFSYVGSNPYNSYNDGSGIDIIGNAVVSGNVVRNNQSCGIDVLAGAAVSILGNNVYGNINPNTAGADCRVNPYGILVHVSVGTGTSQVNVASNLVENNDDGGIDVYGGTNVTLQNNIIRNNGKNSVYTTGLGVGAYGINRILILQNQIYSNAGSGLAIDDLASAVVSNNVIYNNNSSSDNYNPVEASIGSYYTSGQSFVLTNNLIVATKPGVTATGCENSIDGNGTMTSPPAIWDHNDILGAQLTPAPTPSACLLDIGSYGELSADPKFLNAASSDFHLNTGSPVIDAGNNNVPLLVQDLDNHSRFQDATGKGYPIIDMGTFESPGNAATNFTRLALTPSKQLVDANSTVTLTAVATAPGLGTPTGAVTFLQDGQVIGTTTLDANGNAVLTTAGLTPGLHSFVATYPGQGAFTPSVSIRTIVSTYKYAATITLTSSENPSYLGDSVTFTAVASYADGQHPSSINFYIGSQSTVPTDANGKATVTTAVLPLGPNGITASTVPDQLHQAGLASLDQVVLDPKLDSLTVQSSANPSISGQSVTFTATLSAAQGTPTGNLHFTDSVSGSTYTTTIAAPTWTTSTLSVGAHTITVTYDGDSAHNTATASIVQQVNSGYPTTTALTAAPNPAQLGANVTFTVHVTSPNGTPTGNISLTDNGATLTTQPLTSGAATYTTATLTRGSHTILASYTGATPYSGSSASVVQVISGVPSTTTLTATPTTAYAYTAITIQASTTVQNGATPTGTALHILDNGTPLTNLTIAANGTVSTTTQLTTGAHTLTATYDGDNTANSSTSAPVIVTVNPNATATALNLTTQQGIAFHNLGATTTVTSATSSGVAPIGAVTLTGIPGNITATLNAGAAATTLNLPAGTYTIAATYTPSNTNFTGSASLAQTLTVARAPTATTLAIVSASPVYQFAPVTFKATVDDTTGRHLATGTATLVIDGNTVATAPLAADDTSTLTAPSLSAGPHTISVLYSGDSNFLPSTSAQTTLTILPNDFTLTAPATVTIPTEHHHTVTVQLASLGNFSGTVALACANLPPHATCTFSNAAPSLTAGGSTSTTFILDTDDILQYQPEAKLTPLNSRRTALAAILAAPLLFLLARRRRSLQGILAIALLAILTATLNGCSGKYPDHTDPGTYTITLTGAATQTQHTQTIQLVVTQE